MKETLLSIENLKTYFNTDMGTVKAVDGVSFSIKKGETVGLVGESGCGKSVTSLSILQLVPFPGGIVDGDVLFYRDEDEPLNLADHKIKGDVIRRVRGEYIGFIFQEPMTSLSPVHTIGNQICERILTHENDVSRGEARQRVIQLLKEVGLPRAHELIDTYSFELSGGMRQRAMIAMALACYPELLIADEPTTALDVTVQAQIIELINNLREDYNMSVLNITHDLGVIAEMAETVVVMYLGKVVEKGDVHEIYNNPVHPYTDALMRSIPSADIEPKAELAEIKGSVPEPYNRPTGCGFGPRCQEFKSGLCDAKHPSLKEVKPGHFVSCLRRGGNNNE